MIHELTQERLKKDHSSSAYLVGFVIFVFSAMMSFFLISGNVKDVSAFAMISLFVFVLAGLGIYAGMSTTKKKRITKIETSAKSFSLFSGDGQEIINYETIEKIDVRKDFSGETVNLLLLVKKRPILLLSGFENMAELAAQLEKKAPEIVVIKTTKGVKPTLAKKIGVVLIVAAMAALGIGFVFLLIKLGFGFAIAPLSFVFMGISRFASSRGKRGDRIAGILMIFGGIVWAVINFLSLLDKVKG